MVASEYVEMMEQFRARYMRNNTALLHERSYLRVRFSRHFPLHLAASAAKQGWTASGPSHDDQNPSLSIRLGKEGQPFFHCFAGCTDEAIRQALDLKSSDLLPVDPAASPRRKETTQRIISLLDLAQKKVIPWKFLCNLDGNR